jgi:acyl-CoA hydrolase
MENSSTKKPKAPSQSTVESRYLVMPDHASPNGTAFGGVIVSWIDMTASMAAAKHCEKEVVTVGIDSIYFRKPVNVGDQVALKAFVNYVGQTSMEVGVQVIKENPTTGHSVKATSAHLTFVALDENRQPTAAIPIIPQTEEEKRRYENAKLRVKTRKELLKKIRLAENDS